jgi:putative hemolysin
MHNEDYEIIKRDDGSFLTDGQIPFYDFLSRFNKTDLLQQDEQQYDTLAGCILHELERIPQSGDKMDWNGFHFEIIDMDGHRIDKVLVTADQDILDEMEE